MALPGKKVTELPTKSVAVESGDKFLVIDQADGLSKQVDKDNLPTVVNPTWKSSVRVATTGPVAWATGFAAGQTIDGVVLAEGDRILNKDAADGTENGILVAPASGAPSRASDYAAGSSAAGTVIPVEEGTVNADLSFVCTNDSGSDVVGTDALTFVVFGQAAHAATHVSGGSDEIDGCNVACAFAPSNYSKTGDTIQGQLEGIDNKLSGGANGVVVQDANGDATVTRDLAVTRDLSVNPSGVGGVDALNVAGATGNARVAGTLRSDNDFTVQPDGGVVGFSVTAANGAISAAQGNFTVDASGNITNVGTVSGVTVSSHAARHERGGADEIDGDHLDIDFTPTNYTPSTAPAEAAHVDDLAAHLSGIDTALGAAGSGDVTAAANIADHAIVRGDGGAKGVQGSTPTIDDSGHIASAASVGLSEQGTAPATPTNAAVLYSQDDGSTNTELFCKTPDGTEARLHVAAVRAAGIGDFSVSGTDHNRVVHSTSDDSRTCTVDQAFPGCVIPVFLTDDNSGQVTFAAGTGVTLEPADGKTLVLPAPAAGKVGVATITFLSATLAVVAGTLTDA